MASGDATVPLSDDDVIADAIASGVASRCSNMDEKGSADHFIVRVLQPATDAFSRLPEEDDEESRLRNGIRGRSYSQEDGEGDRWGFYRGGLYFLKKVFDNFKQSANPAMRLAKRQRLFRSKIFFSCYCFTFNSSEFTCTLKIILLLACFVPLIEPTNAFHFSVASCSRLHLLLNHTVP